MRRLTEWLKTDWQIRQPSVTEDRWGWWWWWWFCHDFKIVIIQTFISNGI